MDDFHQLAVQLLAGLRKLASDSAVTGPGSESTLRQALIAKRVLELYPNVKAETLAVIASEIPHANPDLLVTPAELEAVAKTLQRELGPNATKPLGGVDRSLR